MKTFKPSSKQLISISKKKFAGGSSHAIDKDLKEFDIAFVGGNHVGNMIKYMQKTNFHGTMAGFNARTKFFNEHQYEYGVHCTLAPHLFLAGNFSANFDNIASLVVPHRITKFNPEKNQMTDDRGVTFSYKSLVLNTGLEQNVKNMPFVEKYTTDGDFALSRVFIHQPGSQDVSHIDRNKRLFSMHKDLDIIVYLPKYPSRRESVDAWYLALDMYFTPGLQSQALPANTKIRVITPNNNLFNMPFANEVVMEEINQREMIETHFGWELVNIEVIEKGINSKIRYATFKNEKGEEMRIPFGSLLLTPESKPKDCYKNSGLTDSKGLVTVNPYSLQHTKYPNIFAFGDCIDAQTTRGFYATLNQGVVVRNNLTSFLEGKELNAVYEGYSSFAVNHAIDRQWIFSHRYNYVPTAMNFYVPRFFGLTAYKFKSILENQFFNKVFSSKPNYGYPYLMKNRYFRPLNENRYLSRNNISPDQVNVHPIKKPHLSFEHHGDHGHVAAAAHH